MRIRAVVTAMALLSLAACGGEAGTPTASTDASNAASSVVAPSADGGSEMSSAPSNSDSAGASDASTAGDASSGGDEGGIDQPSAPDEPASGAGEGAGDAAFCKQLLDAEDQLEKINEAFTTGNMQSASSMVEADMQVFQKLADSAPSEIAPAMQDLVTVLDAAAKALAGNSADASAMAGMQSLGNDVTAIGNYLSDNCAAYAG